MLTRLIKFVAVLLVGSSLVIPGSAVGACLLEILAARHCVPICPMMIDTKSGSEITGQHTSGEGFCCQLSAVPPITKKFTFAKQNRGNAQIDYLQSAGVTISPPVVDQTAFHRTGPPPKCSAHRSHLCTFLI